MIVTVQDLRTCRFCASGARRWFDLHKLNWSDFVMRGIDSETLLMTGDSMASQVVDAAVLRIQQEDQK